MAGGRARKGNLEVVDHAESELRARSKGWPTSAALGCDELLLLQALILEPSKSAVAERLGCSTRHLRRRIHALLVRLGVSTSHAAVALAAWHGWLSEENLERLVRSEIDQARYNQRMGPATLKSAHNSRPSGRIEGVKKATL